MGGGTVNPVALNYVSKSLLIGHSVFQQTHQFWGFFCLLCNSTIKKFF